MLRIVRFPVIAFWLVLPVVAFAQQQETAAELEGLDEFITGMMQEWKVPGLAIAVVKDGEVIHSAGYGYRNVEEKLPVTPKTLFAIGSITKSFTVTGLGMLADEGKLDWDKPVRTYLPDFQLYDPIATLEMTPRDLVTHRSGLPRHDALWYGSPFSRKQLYERLRYLEPSKEFRTTWQYQNLMFMTAGMLAGRVNGTTWEELTRKRILEPLGMERSNFSVKESPKSDDFAYPYREREDKVERIPLRNIDAVGPAGSINSCVEEMIRYVAFHINKGKHGDKQLLSAAMAEQMQTPQMVIPGRIQYDELGHSSYAMGLGVDMYRGHKLVSHGGGIDGFIAQLSFLPREKMGVIVLTNFSGNNPVPVIVTRNVYDRLLGLDPVDWVARVKQQQEKAEKARDEAKKNQATDRKEGTSPSHELAAYAGRYEHPGYGVVTIELDGSALKGTFNEFTLPLEHYHYDMFAGGESEGGRFEGAKISFLYNKKGDIDRVAIPLEPAVDDIVFQRVADPEMRKKEFLEPLAGEYVLREMTATVALKGEDTLTLTVPGQPTYTLVPVQGTSFDLEGLKGFSVEFKRDAAGNVTEVVITQPNGTFVAKRKEAQVAEATAAKEAGQQKDEHAATPEAAEHYDVIISGGLVADGTGNAAFYGDVAIRADRIVKITPAGMLDGATATHRIAARGLVVAPGFIDIQSHSRGALLTGDGRVIGKVTQGVTTEVLGEGWTNAPANEKTIGLTADPETAEQAANFTGPHGFDKWLRAMQEHGSSVNFGSFLGSATVRAYVKGAAQGAPTSGELETMRQLVKNAMEDGAFGLASALIYPPDNFVGTEDLIELSKVMAPYGGVYITHMRSEADKLLEAIDEAIEIGRKGGVPVEIYHLKAAGRRNWHKAPLAVARIQAAREEGLDVGADMYPYIAGSTGLTACLPPWASADGKLFDNLADPEMRAKIRAEVLDPQTEWENLGELATPEGVLVLGLEKEENQKYAGKRLSEIAAEQNKHWIDAAMDLILSERQRIGTVYFMMSEENVALQMRQPWIKFGTDAGGHDPENPGGLVHPRSYGTYPRILGKYVREERVMTLEEAIRKMSSAVAARLSVRNRGLLREGFYADVVVFDPETVADRATFEQPHQLSVGVKHVLVNGTTVVLDGKHTDAKPGRIVRGPGYTGE